MPRRYIFAVVVFLLLAANCPASDLPQLRRQLALAQTDKDPDSIIELSRRIITADPRDLAVWTAMIHAQIQNADYGRALASLATWEKIPKSPGATINAFRGDIYLAQDHPADAEKAWRASLATKPKDFAVLSKLADLLETQERWPEVLDLRTRAAAARPTAALLAAKAGALLHMHQWDAAAAAIQKANQLDATDATVQQWLPKIELLGKSLEYIKSLDKQIAAPATRFNALLDQAAEFVRVGQPSLALSNAKQALAMFPNSVRARIQAGEALLDLNKIDEAAKYKVSHDLARGEDKHVPLALLRDLGSLDNDVGREPKNPLNLARRSKALRKLNQYVLALEDAKAALRADANSPDAEFEMGHDLDALGRPGEALPHIIRATELRPGDPVAWYYRGIVEANRTDFKSAIASQTRSIDLRESAVAYKARMDCELRLSMAGEASADLTRLKQIEASVTASPSPTAFP